MNIKKLLGITAGCLLWAGLASAQPIETNVTFAVNQGIPDANANGLASFGSIAMPYNTIASLTVSLDITGGANGDLYAYLTGPNGGFAILLNRTGVSNNASAFGYSDAGFNVTLSDAAANGDVHFYQNVSTPNGGQLTGTWAPDGRNIDPMGSPATFLTAGRTATLSSFGGTNPNGTWTLFVADLTSGGQATLVSWGLDITAVPEPSTVAMGLMGLAMLAGFRRVRRG
jgi:subtilisin-like proprotein convertase family protein